MKKNMIMWSLFLAGLFLCSLESMAETITICYKGEILTLEQRDSERFFELGARSGECPEKDRDNENDSEKGQGGEKAVYKFEKDHKQEHGPKKQGDSAQGENGQGKGQTKVTICHKGKMTITVAEPALKAHLAHGDTIGACAGTQQNVGQHIQQFNGVDSGDSQSSAERSKSGRKNSGKGGKEHKGTGKKSK